MSSSIPFISNGAVLIATKFIDENEFFFFILSGNTKWMKLNGNDVIIEATARQKKNN